MPKELHLALDAELESHLEAVRDQQGLESLDQAAEWLMRRRLRKGTIGLTGRGRALYPINNQGGSR
ncbi:hypothetical protein HCU01_33630 [Halomonas cupida]|uniref:Uncharacterized protein n=1 Tax=Halomonas cupida TaxID=44933 RepID=A0A1M7KFW5_9GAMM|nr:hypothetical protein [Halomonas cupida]GEN25414.1 hypothetical protein HCU01_33630 [Halomonas cupida]SHM64232.1 hypothetical protein SAMN05660971_03490 [Halomonas cupida]